jgi:hypothetical protein
MLRNGHVSVAKDCGVGSTQASTSAWSSIELELYLCRGKINVGGLRLHLCNISVRKANGNKKGGYCV